MWRFVRVLVWVAVAGAVAFGGPALAGSPSPVVSKDTGEVADREVDDETAVGSDAGTLQSSPRKRPPFKRRVSNAFRHTVADAGYLVTFPARPTRRGVIRTSIVLGGTGLLIAFDDEIRETVQDHRSSTLDDVESWIEPLGSGQVTAAGSILVYVCGRLAADERVTETGRGMIEALFFTQLFTATFKGALGRTGPGEEDDAGDFFAGGTVFPSGHTSRAFALATVLAERHGRVAAWIAYPLASLVGLSRVYSDVHWASDVLAGAALGWAVGKAVVSKREERARQRATEISLYPSVSPGRRAAGILVTLRF
jgi:membrane-associated phospholipid phosphatase